MRAAINSILCTNRNASLTRSEDSVLGKIQTQQLTSSPNKVSAVTDTDTLTKDARELVYFTQKLSTASHKAEETTSDYAKNYLDHIITDQASFEYTCLYLILSYFLKIKCVQIINTCRALFYHFNSILLYMKPRITHNLFQHDPGYVSQPTMPMERSMQFLFLTLIHRLHVPSIIRSLIKNCTALHRDPVQILESCKDILLPDLLK